MAGIEREMQPELYKRQLDDSVPCWFIARGRTEAIITRWEAETVSDQPIKTSEKPKNSCIRTYTGILFDFLEPDNFNIVDISHALSQICRFGGHCLRPYSVAEHSVRVSYACPPEVALWGLCHDMGEAYVGDVCRPLKHLLNMTAYRNHERRTMSALCAWLGLGSDEPAEVKAADRVLLVTEQRDLMHGSIPDFDIIPLKNRIKPWPYQVANYLFQLRYAELKGWKLLWTDRIILWWLKRTLI